MSAFTDALQPASFRGVPFGVLTNEGHFGRRVALHEYPYRDDAWAEDIGRLTRPFAIQGFLVTDSRVYGGGEVIAQRDALKKAIETPGSGLLVHPTLGEITVAGTVAITERWDGGRYFELQFSLVEDAGAKLPATPTDTVTNVTTSAAGADQQVASTFADVAGLQLPVGNQTFSQIQGGIGGWTSALTALGADPTSLTRLASQLAGPYGRFFNAGLAGVGVPLANLFAAGTTVATLVGIAAGGRAALAKAAAAETAIGAALGLVGSMPSDLALAAQASTAALAATAANPGDAIRLLAAAAVRDDGLAAPMAEYIGDLHRRSAVIAMARASAAYKPSSFDDALAVRGQVTAAIDAEIQVAGDQGDDAVFASLRTLRAAVADDLTARGAALPAMTEVVSAAPVPALVLAQRLYRDATRADQLVAEANPPNPLFMPLDFDALAA